MEKVKLRNLLTFGLLLVICALWSIGSPELPESEPSDVVYELDGIRLGMTEGEVRAVWGKVEKSYQLTGDLRLSKPGSDPIVGNICLFSGDGTVVSVLGRRLRENGSLVLSTNHQFRDDESFGEKVTDPRKVYSCGNTPLRSIRRCKGNNVVSIVGCKPRCFEDSIRELPLEAQPEAFRLSNRILGVKLTDRDWFENPKRNVESEYIDL